MTKKFADTLGLPHLDDILRETGQMPEAPPEPEEAPMESQAQGSSTEMLNALQMADKSMAMLDGRDHADAMDRIFKEALGHAQNIMDLGFNVDQARAPRVFEVAGQFYKHAMDAKNSKRDAQLKAMQLMINQQKLELDKQSGGNDPKTIEANAVVVEDRNELIKRLLEERKNQK